MKKIIFFIFLFFTSSLFANDPLDDFLNQQIKVEAKFLDQNLSLEKKITLKKKQAYNYQKFFLYYSAKKDEYLKTSNPYRDDVSKLQFQLQSDIYKGNTKAIIHGEILLHSYAIRSAIRKTLHEILQQSGSNSQDFFRDKIGELLVKRFSEAKPLDITKYAYTQDKSIKEAIEDYSYLQNVANTFSSELIENSSNIYQAAKLSNSKIFTLIYTINTSTYGEKANTYLSPLHLNFANIILFLALIILLFIFQIIMRLILNRILHHYNLKKEDIHYIHAHITKIFNIITSLFVIHLILAIYLNFDSHIINISKIFAILYIILIALLLYRITNTLAYIKREQMKSSKILKNEVINLAIKVINSLIILIAFIIILKVAGVNLTALLSGLGIGGFAVAFAAKDSIANIFGSISILAGDLFKQGDWIELGDINGTVVEIGLRGTTIRTFDNALISIPNFKLANDGIKNWSRRSIGRRIKMIIGVTYESSFDDIRQAILDIRAMLKVHPGIADNQTKYQNSYRHAKLVSSEDFKGVKRATIVHMDEFSDSSINILIYCFTRSVIWNDWLEVKEDVMFKVADILAKNNLEFAYPSLTLHHSATENTPDIKIPIIGD